MRFLNDQIISAANASTNSSAIDASQMIALSVQGVFSDAATTGTLKLQASNDHITAGNVASAFTVTNWTDISGASSAVAGGASVLIPLTNVQYQWIRAVWTRTAGAGTILVTLKSVGY